MSRIPQVLITSFISAINLRKLSVSDDQGSGTVTIIKLAVNKSIRRSKTITNSLGYANNKLRLTT